MPAAIGDFKLFSLLRITVDTSPEIIYAVGSRSVDKAAGKPEGYATADGASEPRTLIARAPEQWPINVLPLALTNTQTISFLVKYFDSAR